MNPRLRSVVVVLIGIHLLGLSLARTASAQTITIRGTYQGQWTNSLGAAGPSSGVWSAQFDLGAGTMAGSASDNARWDSISGTFDSAGNVTGTISNSFLTGRFSGVLTNQEGLYSFSGPFQVVSSEGVVYTTVGTLSGTQGSGQLQSIAVTPSDSTVVFGAPVTLDVIATYGDGSTWDVSNHPATVYSLTHGTGTLDGPTYTANQAETALISISYSSGGVTVYTSAAIAEVDPTPALTAVSPNSATAGSGATTITLTGTNFVAGSTVQWNGSALTTTFVSATQLTATVPAADLTTAGTFSVTINNPTPGGGTSGAVSFTVNNPAPTLTAISPNSAAAGSGATTIALTGSNFVSGAVARWNGSALATTFVSTTQLTATVPSADLTTAGTFSVTVNNPPLGGGTSGAVNFTVDNPTPTLMSLNPSSATVGSGDTAITFTGTAFVAGSTVQWNGSALTTTFISATQLTATVPAADLTTAGTFSVTINNPTPGGGTSGAISFTVNNPAPTLTAISPNAATAGSDATTITLTGANFVSGSTAQWNGSALATTFVSTTQLSATVPATDLATAGTVIVTVSNPTPGGGTSSAVTFTVNNPAPMLTSISPNAATVGSADTTITLTGSNFVLGSIVQWNGSPLATTFVSSTKLTAIVPSPNLTTVGAFGVTVNNPTPGGGTSAALTFTVISNPAPLLTTISPRSTTVGSPALTVTATGAGFVANSTARWDGAALATTYGSGTSLTFVVPQSKLTATGAHKITVKNPTPGGGTSAALTFTVLSNPAPTLASISPNSASVGSPTVTVTATGKNFVASSVAQWDGTALTTTPGSSTSLSFVIPQSKLTASGAHKVTIKNPTPGGGTSAAVTFTVNNVVPTLTSVNPNSATTGAAATTIILAGTGFVSGSTTLWNGANLTTTFVSAIQLKAVVPTADLATAGTFNIAVKAPAPGGGTSNTVAFTVNNPSPTLTSITPNTALVGSAAVTVTATGKGFVKTSVAQWDGVALATTYKSATSLTFVVPKANLATVGAHSITITSPTPGGGTSAALTFTVNNPTPTLKSLTPTTAKVGSASLKVTATGTGFLIASQILFDGAALSTTYVSATSLTFTVPSSSLAAAGAHKVTVKNPTPGGGTSGAVTFTVK